MRPPPGGVSSPARQGPDWWFPWVVGAFGAVTTLVWGGASLATTSRGRPRVRFTDAGTALLRLPTNLSDPREAWPEPARSDLPGPLAYWACQAIVVLAVAAVAVVAWWAWRKLTSATGPLGTRGDAGFARRKDLRRLTVARPVAGRVTVGRSNGRLLACEPQASLAVVGPSGCGKTAGFAIPAILEWEGPVIATSVKADLLEATIKLRRRNGRVWVYDPAQVSGQTERALWSPLPAAADWVEAMRLSAAMVQAVQPRRDNVEDANYWYSQAAKGLAPYLHAAAVGGYGLADVVRWVDTQQVAEAQRALERNAILTGVHAWTEVTRDVRLAHRWDAIRDETMDAFRRMVALAPDDRAELAELPEEQWPADLLDELHNTVEHEWQAELRAAAGDPGAPLAAAQSLWGKEPKLRGSVYATMEIVLRAWADPGVGALARPDPEAVDIDEWLSGDNTIYVVATGHEQHRLRPVLSVLMQQAIRRAYDTATRDGGRLARPCLMLLDEAGNIAPLPDLPGYVSTARSHGITLVTVWQDLAQITALYGERSRTVLNNHRAKLFGTGIGDELALEYVSRLVGDEQRTERNISTDLHGGRRSISEHHLYRRAAPADLVRRLAPDDALLIYGSELPARVRLRPWFADKQLRSLADRPDLIDAHQGG